MKKIISTTCFLLLCSLLSISAYQVEVPDEIPAFRNLVVPLSLVEQEEPLSQARLYFQEFGKPNFSYAEFEERDGVWYTMVPSTYLNGEEFIYYVQAQTIGGKFIREPQIGTKRARLVKDERAPALKLMTPEELKLERGTEQLVVFQVLDESAIADFSVTVDGVPIEKAMVFRNVLSFLVTPDKQAQAQTVILVSLTDRYANAATEEFVFALADKKKPFFSASTDYVANLKVTYALRMGEGENSVDLETVFSDLDQSVELQYELGGDAQVGMGPLGIDLNVVFADNIAVTDITEAYPNTLIADYQNFMNLLHPWNFANEFDYTGEEARLYANANQFTAKVSFFDPILSYTFGDQQLDFQEQTVSNLAFRGSAIAIDLPFFTFSLGKGLSNLGLYQSAWPQNFFGLQLGFDVKDVWWFQTNTAFLSSLQGRYDTLVTSGTSAIGTLYDLGTVKPEQNMVVGLSTGINNRFFTFSTDFGLTLYSDDASQIIDKDKLVTDIEDEFGFDLGTYMGYVDSISRIFPVLDYFPITNGLLAEAINKELWGVTLGANLDFPTLGVETWFRMTDGTYKSLGASVASDQMDWGGNWSKNFGGYAVSAGYNWNKDNLPDILFTNILPIVKPDLAGTPPDPTANDISHIVQTATAGLETPFSPVLGTFSLGYSFIHASSNAAKLADEVSDDAAAMNAIKTSAENDTTLTHTGELRWKSKKFNIGPYNLSIGAKTKDSYVTETLVDGIEDGTTYWNFSYGVSPSFRFGRYGLNLNFDHEWSTQSGSETAYGYDVKLTIAETFFDSISFGGGFDQQFVADDLQAYRINGKASVDKRLGVLGMTSEIEVSYFDSMLDNADDSTKISFNIAGSIAF